MQVLRHGVQAKMKSADGKKGEPDVVCDVHSDQYIKCRVSGFEIKSSLNIDFSFKLTTDVNRAVTTELCIKPTQRWQV